MPAARYWRINGIETYGGGDLELTEFALYEAGVRVDTGLTAPVPPSAGTLAALSDGDNLAAVRWTRAAYSLPGFSFVFDLGSAKLVDEIRIGAGALQSEFLFSLGVQTSSDGVVWSQSAAFNGVTWPGAGANAVTSGPFSEPSILLLSFDGENNSTVFTDSSCEPKPITKYGDAKISTAQSKFGGASGLFDGFGDYLLVENSQSISFGAQDFTIRAWVFPTTTGELAVLGKRDGPGSYSPICIFIRSSKIYVIGSFSGSSWGINSGFTNGSIDIPSNQWTHIEVVRDGATLRTFVNGVADYTFSVGTSTLMTNTTRLSVGASTTAGTNAFTGYIDDLEIVLGVAMHTSAFTPPTVAAVGFAGFTGQRAPRGTFSAAPQLASPYEPPPFGVKFEHPLPERNHRRDFEGWGRIVGTTKETALPSNTPLRRHVYCMDMLTSTVVADMWSDATTGAYVFNDLDLTRRYTVFAYDYTGMYGAVIADNLTPELMP